MGKYNPPRFLKANIFPQLASRKKSGQALQGGDVSDCGKKEIRTLDPPPGGQSVFPQDAAHKTASMTNRTLSILSNRCRGLQPPTGFLREQNDSNIHLMANNQLFCR
jgi:hypothetical protein